MCKNVSMEYCSNVIDWGKLKYFEKSLSQCHVICHKSHIDY